MGKAQKKRGIGQRLRDLLTELDRLLNPPQPIPVRVPARVRRRY
jgi:hypothetical protein